MAFGINDAELWRSIPLEEKFGMMNRAHGKGILAALIVIIVTGTCAVGLQLNWILWLGLLVSPMVFQFGAAKAWRDLRPRLMLEYLAARSMSRRFAFISQSRALTPQFIFRARVREEVENQSIQDAVESMIIGVEESRVWVALFMDTMILMAEKPGGAKLSFGAPLSTLTLNASSPSGQEGYASDTELSINYNERGQPERNLILTSEQPAALIVFEKMVENMKQPAGKTLLNELPLDDIPEDLIPDELMPDELR